MSLERLALNFGGCEFFSLGTGGGAASLCTHALSALGSFVVVFYETLGFTGTCNEELSLSFSCLFLIRAFQRDVRSRQSGVGCVRFKYRSWKFSEDWSAWILGGRSK